LVALVFAAVTTNCAVEDKTGRNDASGELSLKLALRLFDPHYDLPEYKRSSGRLSDDRQRWWLGAAQAQIVIKLIETYRGTAPAVQDRSLALHGS
jgi:hypothetical protein